MPKRKLPPLYWDRTGKPIECLEWAKLFESWAYRCIGDEAFTSRDGRTVRVVTAWFGIRENYFDALEPPEIFQTAVFVKEDEHNKLLSEWGSTSEEQAKWTHDMTLAGAELAFR